MQPWLETAGVVLLAIAGAFAGRACSRLPGRWWAVGYAVPLAFVLLVVAERRFYVLGDVPPFSWVLSGRAIYAVMAAACPMLLVTPLSRLPHRRQRFLVAGFAGLFATYFSVLPFLLPAFFRDYLLSLPTKVDNEGVCLQGTPYTCGPAAAVTALRKLGFAAEEGEIAVLCRTVPLLGTSADTLRAGLTDRYAGEGLSCTFRRFDDISELGEAMAGGGAVLVVVKHSLMVDHFVTVLAVTDDAVVVGDPLIGKRRHTFRRFAEMWRSCGIVLTRPRPVTPSAS